MQCFNTIFEDASLAANRYYDDPTHLTQKEAIDLYYKKSNLNRPERASYLAATLTGLGGALTGGPLYNYYSQQKQKQADISAGLARGESDAPLKYDNTGTSILLHGLSAIPGPSAIFANLASASLRNASIDKMDAEMDERRRNDLNKRLTNQSIFNQGSRL